VDFSVKKNRQPNAALQRPGDNRASGKLSMRGTLIPVRCKRLLDCVVTEELVPIPL
jgi:hypothetical protein